MYSFHWSHAPSPTTQFNLCWEWTKGETYLPWLRQGYNTSMLMSRVRFWASAKFWVLLLNNLTVVKNLSLNTIDPQPPPSSTYKIRGLGIALPEQINTVRRKINIYELGHDRTSWLIGPGLSDCLSDQVRAKVVCCKSLTTLLLDQWLLNHQGSVLAHYGLPPTGSLIGGGLTPLKWCSWRFLQSQSTGWALAGNLPYSKDVVKDKCEVICVRPFRLKLFLTNSLTSSHIISNIKKACQYWLKLQRHGEISLKIWEKEKNDVENASILYGSDINIFMEDLWPFDFLS